MNRPGAEPLHPVARDLSAREGGRAAYPPVERWDDWEELDPIAWPRKVRRGYGLIPTICFNCEAACGLLAYVDKTTGRIQKFEGNPVHPGSRGRNCAKGPATLNQVQDAERILYPLRRVGARGAGQWERVTWDAVLDDIAGRIRKALVEGRPKEVMYHLGRPGHELVYLQRVFHAWGIDGHNSHTNVCSASARAGYAFWHGMDRPSPDHANARFILLLSSHLETGHYFNPHAQRIIEAKSRGAKVAVIDSRLSNTASMADYWLAPWPGSESALLLAMAHVLIREKRYDADFVRRWTNWDEYLREGRGKLAMYFTRVYNPVWTNPDGMSWIEMLTDEAKVERHACLTPVWSETAWFADYVLPMGHASERHDLMSQETHAARWIGFRQPVLRVALAKRGKTFDFTWQAHEAAGLGQVWEEDEFWIELSWRIDPDGALGIRKYFESPYRAGAKLRIEEFYRWLFA